MCYHSDETAVDETAEEDQMKTMIKNLANAFVKALAKWILSYLPKVALWAIKLGADKTADSEKTAYVLFVVKCIATEAVRVARIMEDGEVTEQEEMEVEKQALGLVEKITAAF